MSEARIERLLAELDGLGAESFLVRNDALYQRLAGESLVGRTEADVAW